MDLEEIQSVLRLVYRQIESLENDIASLCDELMLSELDEAGGISEHLRNLMRRMDRLERREFELLRKALDQRPIRLILLDEEITKKRQSIEKFEAQAKKGDRNATRWAIEMSVDLQVLKEQRETLIRQLNEIGLRVT